MIVALIKGHQDWWGTGMDKILNGLTIHETPIKIRRHSKRVQAAELAQLVEHATENRSVRGPIPRLGTTKDLATPDKKREGRGLLL